MQRRYRKLQILALGHAANVWRSCCPRTQFVGVTGSWGKTTTTTFLSAMLASSSATRTGAVHNEPKDIVKTILHTEPWRHRYCVQEISGHRPGAISACTRIFRPDVGIVTGVAGDHRKAFAGSWEATAAEKAKLVHGLPADGLAVINADDPLVAAMADGCRCKLVTYGYSENTDLRILSASSTWPDRLTFEVSYRGERFAVVSRVVGVHWALALSAALLTALELGISREACLKVLESREPARTRMSVHPGPNGSWYVLDTRKASFSGIETCLGFLGAARAPRKTVIIGTISDYPGSRRAHYSKVARMCLDKADRTIFTGPNAQSVRRLAAGEFAGRLSIVERPDEVVRLLGEDAVTDELIYVKSSQADRLGRLFLSNAPVRGR